MKTTYTLFETFKISSLHHYIGVKTPFFVILFKVEIKDNTTLRKVSEASSPKGSEIQVL